MWTSGKINYPERISIGYTNLRMQSEIIKRVYSDSTLCISQCRSYFMFHGMDANDLQALFKYLPLLSFTESYIYQVIQTEAVDCLFIEMINFFSDYLCFTATLLLCWPFCSKTVRPGTTISVYFPDTSYKGKLPLFFVFFLFPLFGSCLHCIRIHACI